jgi:tRNA (mo5U34)-methyltransferase
MPIETEKLQQLKQQMAGIPWYHEIDLGPELGVTPGGCKNDHIRLGYMNLPPSLEGLDVLDIGSWDGLFAFEAERRGASTVVATDIWGDYRIHDGRFLNGGEGIKFACEVLHSKVKLLYASVYELPSAIWNENPEYLADVVMFPGVLYHLKNPLAALEAIYTIMAPDGLLILETHIDLVSLERPAMALYEKGAGGDETNYTGPNRAAVELLLKWAGFRDLQFQGGINLDQWPDLRTVNMARAAWHARK